MYQSLQKKLLLKYPLIWNTKFVQMFIFGILLHLVLFGLGYLDGTIDFSNQNNIAIEVTSILFGILVIILVLIIWLVFYFKNNALKSFYQKSKYSLFYEFFQILIICTLLTTFYIPFKVGKQFHQASYYSLEETQKRCKTIACADIFIDGNFKQTEIDSLASGLIDSLGNLTKKAIKSEVLYNDSVTSVDVEVAAREVFPVIHKDHIFFRGKKYDQYSLMNRQIYNFSVISREKDSINELEVKNWLYENDQKAVKGLMKDYMDMLKEHHLETNLTLNNWYKITYTYPDFKDFLYIYAYKNKYEATPNYYNYYSDYNEGQTEPKYSQYFVQQDILKEKYDIVSDAHTDHYIDYDALLIFLYIGLAISILIFSFRVTSGKSWLISVVIIGVLNILSGIFAATLSEENLYLYTILFFVFIFNTYFGVIYFKRESKNFSYIALNLTLWGNPFIIPFIYLLALDHYNSLRSLQNGYYSNPEYLWLKAHTFHLFSINYCLIVISFILFSRIIRNWKGIAEN